jgi:hypothetical protein
MVQSVTTWLYLDDAYCWENKAVIVVVDSRAGVLGPSYIHLGGGRRRPDRDELAPHSGEAIPVVRLTKHRRSQRFYIEPMSLR